MAQAPVVRSLTLVSPGGFSETAAWTQAKLVESYAISPDVFFFFLLFFFLCFFFYYYYFANSTAAG